MIDVSLIHKLESKQIVKYICLRFFTQDADADGSGSVDFGEFVEMMIKVG